MSIANIKDFSPLAEGGDSYLQTSKKKSSSQKSEDPLFLERLPDLTSFKDYLSKLKESGVVWKKLNFFDNEHLQYDYLLAILETWKESIQHLSIRNCPKVSLALKDLSSLTSLTYLSCESTKVTGDISCLAPLKSLKILSLPFTSIIGDVVTISKLQKLVVCNMANTEVTGSATVFLGHKNLSQLLLPKTQVKSKIATFIRLQKQVSVLHLSISKSFAPIVVTEKD